MKLPSLGGRHYLSCPPLKLCLYRLLSLATLNLKLQKFQTTSSSPDMPPSPMSMLLLCQECAPSAHSSSFKSHYKWNLLGEALPDIPSLFLITLHSEHSFICLPSECELSEISIPVLKKSGLTKCMNENETVHT